VGVGGWVFPAILRPVCPATSGSFWTVTCDWTLAAIGNPTFRPSRIAIRRPTLGAICRRTRGRTCAATSTAFRGPVLSVLLSGEVQWPRKMGSGVQGSWGSGRTRIRVHPCASVLQACRIVVFAKMSFRGAERRGISSVGGAELAQACRRVEIPRYVRLRRRRNERNDSRSGTLTFDTCLSTSDLRVLRALWFHSTALADLTAAARCL